MTIKEIRKALRNEFGTRKYRITSQGEIHVYGVMPNTNQYGWYLYGWVDDPQTEERIKSLVEAVK
jgi:hypothetical protein